MKIKAIIFDMDGTITDTSDIWKKATLNLLQHKGIEVTCELKDELVKKTHGLSMRKTCSIIKDMVCIGDSVDDLICLKTEIVAQFLKNEIKFIYGFEQFHKTLAQYQLKTGIATNADLATVKITKEILKIDNFFGKHIYDISFVNNIGKPDPAIYLFAAKQLGVKPEECIAIEDSAHGIRAAKNAGMYCIGINTAKNREQLKEADHIIDCYTELNLAKLIK